MEPYFKDEHVTIYHGDCRQVLPFLGRFDLLLTDPPYGLGMQTRADGGGVCSAASGNKTYQKSDWDAAAPDRWVLEMLLSAVKTAVIWGGNYFELQPSMGWLIWDKGQRNFSLADCELAWTNRNKAARIFECSRASAVQDGKQHPTQKPLALMKWCIEQVGDAQTILDPFAGSGTTGRAAKDLGKQAVLIEREERYCEIAAKRMCQQVLDLSA